MLAALCVRPAIALVPTRAGYSLAVRLSQPSGSSKDAARSLPILIANGLGATLCTIGAIQDALTDAGFTVLSYDRVGVGLSDASPTGRAPTVDECMADTEDVVAWAEGKPGVALGQRWMLLGPSMGSVVCQAYAARHPERAAGFLNMDGFPAPFYAKAAKFGSAARMYTVMAVMARLGVMRAMLSCAGGFFARFASRMFPAAVIRAQRARPAFYTSTGREMTLMTDLARASAEGWGPALDLVRAPAETVRALERAPPARNGVLKCGEWFELPRSKADAAAAPAWLPPAELEPLAAALRAAAARADSPLGRLWGTLPVRVMSARSYEYVGGDSFNDAEMKTWAAAEHAMHALLARDGARYVWPAVGHDKMFLEAAAIAQCCAEIEAAARASSAAASASASSPAAAK